jgi:hypothetical protein
MSQNKTNIFGVCSDPEIHPRATHGIPDQFPHCLIISTYKDHRTNSWLRIISYLSYPSIISIISFWYMLTNQSLCIRNIETDFFTICICICPMKGKEIATTVQLQVIHCILHINPKKELLPMAYWDGEQFIWKCITTVQYQYRLVYSTCDAPLLFPNWHMLEVCAYWTWNWTYGCSVQSKGNLPTVLGEEDKHTLSISLLYSHCR